MKAKRTYEPLHMSFVQMTDKSVLLASGRPLDNNGDWLWEGVL